MAGVFDLDAVVAEAAGEPFVFTFAGEQYELPHRPDIRALAAMSGGRFDDALRLLLGADQWDRLQKAEATFDDRAFQALLNAYTAHSGLSLGEASASTGS